MDAGNTAHSGFDINGHDLLPSSDFIDIANVSASFEQTIGNLGMHRGLKVPVTRPPLAPTASTS